MTVEEKWKVLISAAKNYWIDSIPTGMSDSEFDELERRAIQEDNFYARDYVLGKYLTGTRTENHDITKITKFKISPGKTMLQGMEESEKELGVKLWYDLKYDGSSIAIYIDPTTGIPKRCVTVGNINIGNYGVDQTAKLICLLPNRFPLGIRTIQAEALLELGNLPPDISPEKARQKANGLINSKYCEDEIKKYLVLRAYRYYLEPGSPLEKLSYPEVLKKIPSKASELDGHITFSPADTWPLDKLRKMSGFTETEITTTSTGTFLNDGWVLYNSNGVVQRALKYAGAGSGTEKITTEVLGIQWNNQQSKGKDSFSANVLIKPVTLSGCTITKPSAGSIGKLVKNNITPGAIVSIVLANSTIPMVGEVEKPGNGDFCWPTCGCGRKLGPSDIFGALLKCSNPECSDRMSRMREYLKTLNDIRTDLDLNKFLVIDRFRWENTGISITDLLRFVERGEKEKYHKYLQSYLKTPLQTRNLDVVWKCSWNVLREYGGFDKN